MHGGHRARGAGSDSWPPQSYVYGVTAGEEGGATDGVGDTVMEGVGERVTDTDAVGGWVGVGDSPGWVLPPLAQTQSATLATWTCW